MEVKHVRELMHSLVEGPQFQNNLIGEELCTCDVALKRLDKNNLSVDFTAPKFFVDPRAAGLEGPESLGDTVTMVDDGSPLFFVNSDSRRQLCSSTLSQDTSKQDLNPLVLDNTSTSNASQWQLHSSIICAF